MCVCVYFVLSNKSDANSLFSIFNGYLLVVVFRCGIHASSFQLSPFHSVCLSTSHVADIEINYSIVIWESLWTKIKSQQIKMCEIWYDFEPISINCVRRHTPSADIIKCGNKLMNWRVLVIVWNLKQSLIIDETKKTMAKRNRKKGADTQTVTWLRPAYSVRLIVWKLLKLAIFHR